MGQQNKNLIPRVVHREYFMASGIADVDKEPERFGYVRALGNDVYTFLAERVELAGKVTLRNVHSERLAELQLSVDDAWQQAYGNVARLIESGIFKQSVTRTGTGNDWSVWIGDAYTSSCVLTPEFYNWCCTHLKADKFMVCIASSQLVFVLQQSSRDTLKKFDPVVSKMLEGSNSRVSTEWFYLSAKGLMPLPSAGTSGGTHSGAHGGTNPASPKVAAVKSAPEPGINAPD